MGWFLHISEGADGRWACSHGRRQLDTHERLADAITHMRAHAGTLTGAAEVLVHRLDGAVESLGTVVTDS